MNFKVSILGSGAALPTSTRNPTAQYIECNGRRILIDCGEGTQIQFRKYGVKFQRIEHIFISHLHGDHYFGLVGLLSSMHLLGRKKSIEIYGAKELEEILRKQLEYGGSRLAFDIHFNVLEKNGSGVCFEDDQLTISYFPLSHKVPTNGFVIQQKVKEAHLNIGRAEEDGVKIEYYHRLKKGEDITLENGKILRSKTYTTPSDTPKSYAFCSDTCYFEPIIPFIKNVDVLYHEATFTDDLSDRAKSTKHSTASQAATIAKKAKVGKLLMGHLSARYENGQKHFFEAKPIFENCEVVEDGNEYLL